jgi:hypothetical protein
VPPPPTAVNNINTETAIKVYPNPAGSMINVSGLAATDRLELYDMMGRNVSPVWTISDSEVNDLSLQDIPNGNYILIVKDMAGRTKSHVPVRKQ